MGSRGAARPQAGRTGGRVQEGVCLEAGGTASREQGGQWGQKTRGVTRTEVALGGGQGVRGPRGQPPRQSGRGRARSPEGQGTLAPRGQRLRPGNKMERWGLERGSRSSESRASHQRGAAGEVWAQCDSGCPSLGPTAQGGAGVAQPAGGPPRPRAPLRRLRRRGWELQGEGSPCGPPRRSPHSWRDALSPRAGPEACGAWKEGEVSRGLLSVLWGLRPPVPTGCSSHRGCPDCQRGAPASWPAHSLGPGTHCP